MHGNVAVVRRGYEALDTTDLVALSPLLDENVSWHTPGSSPVAGDAIGRDAVLFQLSRYARETRGTFKADLQRVYGREHYLDPHAWDVFWS